MVKRPLGLNKASKAKKLKRADADVPESQNGETLTIELGDDVDPEDEIAQLQGLYETYLSSGRSNPSLLHGVIHECDGLLRNSDGKKLPDNFHNVYARALYELGKFQDDEEDAEEESTKESKKPVQGRTDFLAMALERANTGLEDNPESLPLLITRAKVMTSLAQDQVSRADSLQDVYGGLGDILEYVQTSTEDFEKVEKLLDSSSRSYADLTIDDLSVVSDVLLVADELGNLLASVDEEDDDDEDEGDDEEDEDDEDDEEDEDEEDEGNGETSKVQAPSDKGKEKLAQENEDAEESEDEGDEEASENSPYQLKVAQAVFLGWCKRCFDRVLEKLPESDAAARHIMWANRGLGQFHTAVAAPAVTLLEQILEGEEDDEEDEEDEDNVPAELNATDSAAAKESLSKAIEHFQKAEDDGSDTLVLAAEAMISLAHFHEVDSDEQKGLYASAVERLRKATRLGLGNFQEQIADLEDEE